MDSNIGKKLDGRYELLELIGVGGMADIYRARDIQEDRIVAVKILKTEFAGSDEFLRRFRNESKAIALLSHPNIVKIYDVGFTDKVQFIVMEYVDGITLTDYIEQQGVLKWRDAVHFTVQVLKALQHAHDRGIVHRDVKSSNIMLLRDGNIKVMDFGIARFNSENNKTVSDKTIGSVHYISPEQARGDLTDERSDIYSVGVALYEMLTGKKPFDGDTAVAIALKHMQSTPKRPTEINSTIPEGIEQIVLRAMQKDPSARYQTAGEMIADLEEFKKNPGIVFDYKYNSTDGSSKFAMSASASSESEKMRFNAPSKIDDDDDENDEYEDEYDDDDDDEIEERRSPLIPILFAVGAAFVVATVFLVLVLLSQRFGNNPSDSDSTNKGTINGIIIENGEFAMPKLVGKTWEEVKRDYDGSSLMQIVAQEEYNGEYEVGYIFEQSITENRMVKVGSTITVKVSKGKRKVEIQDFTDREYEAAKKQLEKDGFKVVSRSAESEEIAEGRVIRTDPPAHELADQGSTVVVIVSMGASEKMKVVPHLVGMTIEDALKSCDECGLIPTVDYKDSDEDKGKVLEQSIDPDEKVIPGTEIVLKVSSGELPERQYSVNISLPQGISGDFEFRFYVDNVLDSTATKIINVGLSSAKAVDYNIKGKSGDEKILSVMVKCISTNKEDVFVEYRFNFTDDKCEETKLTNNGASVFLKLASTSSSTTPTPPESSSSTTPPAPQSSTTPSESSSTPVESSAPSTVESSSAPAGETAPSETPDN